MGFGFRWFYVGYIDLVFGFLIWFGFCWIMDRCFRWEY